MLANKTILLRDPDLQNDIIRKYYKALVEGLKQNVKFA